MATTPSAGVPSLATLVITLNNGQQYPVQFLLPPAPMPDLSSYMKQQDMSGYVSNTFDFAESQHLKALSLRYDIASKTAELICGDPKSPTVISLGASTDGLSNKTGMIPGTDTRGLSLYYSGTTSYPTFTYGDPSSPKALSILTTDVGKSDFLNHLTGGTDLDGISRSSAGIGASLDNAKGLFKVKINDQTGEVAIVLQLTDKAGSISNVLSLTSEGRILSRKGHPLMETFSPKGTSRKILSWTVPRPSGPGVVINFPEAFSSTDNLIVWCCYSSTKDGNWRQTISQPGILVGPPTTTGFTVDDGTGTGVGWGTNYDTLNCIAIGDV